MATIKQQNLMRISYAVILVDLDTISPTIPTSIIIATITIEMLSQVIKFILKNCFYLSLKFRF